MVYMHKFLTKEKINLKIICLININNVYIFSKVCFININDVHKFLKKEKINYMCLININVYIKCQKKEEIKNLIARDRTSKAIKACESSHAIKDYLGVR